jgi:hypothetical protein
VAKYQDGIDITLTANADLDDQQFYFVTASGTAPGVNVSTGASGPAPTGVLQNDPRSGEAATVRILGTTKVIAEADTAIGYGDYLTSGSSGMAVNNSNGSSVAGIALEALASGSGVLIEMMLLPYGSGNKLDNTP